MTDPIWAVGGEQRGVSNWAQEWKLYKKALVVKVEGGQVQRVLEYETPLGCRPNESPAILFKAASVRGNRAYLCTQTEILICEFPSFAIKQVISLPCFNDVHHVAVAADGRLFVAVTGLDAVAELDRDGTLINLTSVIGGSVWDRFSKTTDYRKVLTTKPHRAHPNFVFFIDDQPWVTRFQQRDAIPLYGKPGKQPTFDLGNEGVHDGYVAGGHIYFTTVNGIVHHFDLSSSERKSFDLNSIAGAYRDRPLGWCRGVLPEEDTIWIGFSRIRFTTLRQNLDWARHGFRNAYRHAAAPTRIAQYDLSEMKLRREIDLEDVGLNAIFSIHAANG